MWSSFAEAKLCWEESHIAILTGMHKHAAISATSERQNES